MPTYAGGTNMGAPTGSMYSDSVWATWTTTVTITTGTGNRVFFFGQRASEWVDEPETEEQRQAREREREEREAERERERQERRERRQAAKARGEELLRLVLLPDELAHYERHSAIQVTGSDGRLYRIGKGVDSNVFALEDGCRIAALCCHPDLNPDRTPDSLPFEDVYASQVLQLRHNAPAFWDKANIYWYDHDAEQYRRQRAEHRRVQERAELRAHGLHLTQNQHETRRNEHG